MNKRNKNKVHIFKDESGFFIKRLPGVTFYSLVNKSLVTKAKDKHILEKGLRI